MKLLTLILLGGLFAATLAKADEVALQMLHQKMNACDRDAEANAARLSGECLDVRTKLRAQYDNQAAYLKARASSIETN